MVNNGIFNALVGVIALALPGLGQDQKQDKKIPASIMKVQAQAIAEYRLPFPCGNKYDIDDGRWYRALSEDEIARMIKGDRKTSLDWFYADPRNLYIPFEEASYIVEKKLEGINVDVELIAARVDMIQYFEGLKHPPFGPCVHRKKAH